jgi:hypothetical protein
LPIKAIPDFVGNSYDFGPLPEGEYYLCVQAVLGSGKGLRWADNSPYKITVDLTPPESFALEAVDSPVESNVPTITWQESSGAGSYSLQVARDASCQIIEQSYSGLTTTSKDLDALADGKYFICASAQDEAGNETIASNSGMALTIDSSPSAITGVSTSTGDGAYNAGSTIAIAVKFDRVVSLDAGQDLPRLKLETGASDAFARYASGSGTDTLIFTYTVTTGDSTTDLEVNSTTPQIVYGDRVLRDASGATFISRGNEITSRWLSENHSIYVDTASPVAPTVLVTAQDSASGTDSRNDDDTSIYFAWNAGSDQESGLASYKLDRYDQVDCQGSATTTSGIASSVHSAAFAGALSGTTYSFKVRSVDSAGNEATSPCSGGILVDTAAPSTPPSAALITGDANTGTANTVDNDRQVYFHWTAAVDDLPHGSGISSYTVAAYSQAGCGGLPTLTTGLTTTSFAFTAPTDGTYSYKVSATDVVGNVSAQSPCSGNILIDTVAPIAATGLYAAADSAAGGAATMDNDAEVFSVWTAASDVASGLATYTFHRYDAAACAGTSTDTPNLPNSVTSQTFSGGVSGTTYSFKVTAIDTAGNATDSGCSPGIMVDLTHPVAPSNPVIAADDASDGSAAYDDDTEIFFTWDSASDAETGISSYTVHRYDQANCQGASTDESGIASGTHSLTYASAADGGIYSITIEAFDLVGNSSISPCSADLQVDTSAPPAGPSGLIFAADDANGANATSDDDNDFFLRWDAGDDDVGGSGIADYQVTTFELGSCAGVGTTSIFQAATDFPFTVTHKGIFSFRLVSRDQVGHVSPASACSSNMITDETPPAAATSLVIADAPGGAPATYDNDTSIDLQWSGSSDLDSGLASYDVELYPEAACGGTAAPTTGLATSVDHLTVNVTNGTTYSFKVIAYDNAGLSETSTCSASITIDTSAPAAAAALIVSADRDTDPNVAYDNDLDFYLRWTAASDSETAIESYTVHQFSLGSCSGASDDISGVNTGDLSYPIVSAVAGTTYSFKVTAIDMAGNQSTSSCSSDILIDTTAPSTVATPTIKADGVGGATASYDDDDEVFLVWSAPSDNGGGSGVASYELSIYDQANCGGIPSTISSIAATFYALSPAAEGSHSFKVTAVDNAGNSSSISDCSNNTVVDATAPAAATSLITAADAAGGPNVAFDNDESFFAVWTAASDGGSGLASYSLHLYDQANCGGTPVVSTGILSNATSYEITTGHDGTTYSFKISAFDHAGNTAISSCSGNLAINASPPASFMITGPTATVYTSTPTVTWDDNGGATAWNVIVDDEATCANPNLQTYSGVTGTSQLLTSLSDGTYYVCVEAVDEVAHAVSASNSAYAFEVETTTLHITLTSLNSGTYALKYLKKSGGSWTSFSVASGADPIDSTSSLSLDSDQKAHVSFAVESAWDFLLRYSTNSSGSWSAPETIDSGAGGDDYGFSSTIALDDSDNAVVAYRAIDATNSDEFLKSATGTTGAFSLGTVETLNGAGKAFGDAAIAIDDGTPNIAHLILTSKAAANYTLTYRTNSSGWGTGIDEEPDNLPGSCVDYVYASIALDSSGKPHIAYTCVTNASECKVFYGKKTGPSWTHTEVGDQEASGCTVGLLTSAYRPQLVLDSNNKAHLVYFDAINGSLNYSNNVSGAFGAATVLDNSGTVAGRPAISLDSDGKLYVLYVNATGQLSLKTNNSGSWTTEASIAADVIGVGTAAVSSVKGRSNH